MRQPWELSRPSPRLCSCDVTDTIVNVVANVATGGLYSVAKAGIKTVETGDLSHLMTQGLDLGMAATGNQLAVDVGGPLAGQAFNAAGALAGAAGSAGMFAGSASGGSSGVGVGTVLDPSIPGVAGQNAGFAVPDLATNIAGNVAQGGQAGAGTVLAPGATGMIPAAAPGAVGGFASPDLAAGIQGSINQAGHVGAGTVLAPEAVPSAAQIPGWFASLPPLVQGSLIMGGGQMATGALGGLFNGLSMEKRLALEKEIADRREAQVQRQNQNNAYAPAISFNGANGMIGRA